MNRLTKKDEIIQNYLEKENSAEPNDTEIIPTDMDAYKLVFHSLEKKPSGGLPYKFSSRVIAEIQAREILKSSFKKKLAGLAVLVAFSIISYFCISHFDEELSDSLLKIASTFKWPAAFGLIIYMLVEYLNERLAGKSS